PPTPTPSLIPYTTLLRSPVLMFDDSLSAVDADTEEHILNNMRDQRQGKTNIITAHRMSAVSHADLIIVMDEGTVAEQGTHEQLIDRKSTRLNSSHVSISY